MKLDLTDLKPQEATFETSEKPGKKYTLAKITLRTRIWLRENFKQEEIEKIFENQSLPEISKIAYHLLKEKEEFPTLESFQEAFATQQDFMGLMQAMLTTIGISEPVLEKITKEYEAGNVPSLSQMTGAPSTT